MSAAASQNKAPRKDAIRPLRGELRVPSDKSLSHRVALFAAMAEGTSHISGILDSLDVRSSLGAIEALGAVVDVQREKTGLAGTIRGWGSGGPRKPDSSDASGEPGAPPFFSLDCGNSGTSARLLLGLLAGCRFSALLVGDDSLARRPMNRVTLPLSMMGARFEASHATRTVCATENFDNLPLIVYGNPNLKAIEHHSPVASAQVKSAILLAGLHAEGTTSVIEPSKSRDHTELLLPAFGVELRVEGLKVSIEGGQRPRAPHGLLAVPGDPSSAAFFLVGAALIPKSEVTVRGLLLNPTRTGFLEVMRRMGADITVERLGEDHNAPTRTATFGVELIGDVTVRYRSSLHATKVAAEEVPSLIDELPILALLATSAKGTTTFEGVGELRVKESDRLAAIEEGLRVFGREARSEGDTLFVTGCPSQAGGAVAQAQGARDATLNTYGDHRLAMTWTIANHALGLRHPLDDPACMSVSYPDFLTDLASLCA